MWGTAAIGTDRIGRTLQSRAAGTVPAALEPHPPRSSAQTPAPGRFPCRSRRHAEPYGSASRRRMSRASAFGSSDSNGMPTRCSPRLSISST